MPNAAADSTNQERAILSLVFPLQLIFLYIRNANELTDLFTSGSGGLSLYRSIGLSSMLVLITLLFALALSIRRNHLREHFALLATYAAAITFALVQVYFFAPITFS